MAWQALCLSCALRRDAVRGAGGSGEVCAGQQWVVVMEGGAAQVQELRPGGQGDPCIDSEELREWLCSPLGCQQRIDCFA